MAYARNCREVFSFIGRHFILADVVRKLNSTKTGLLPPGALFWSADGVRRELEKMTEIWNAQGM